MSETAPPAPSASTAPEKPSAAKKAKKPAKAAAAAAARKKPAGPSVSELLVQAVGASKERSGVSLAALKKALAAAGYDVDKNNSRIKLGLKSLVSKGTLLQTKGTGASGSFRLSKKAAPDLLKVQKAGASAKGRKKLGLDPKAPKANQRAQKARAAASPKAARGVRKAPAPKGRPPRKSPAKAKADKPRAARPRGNPQKSKARKAASKK